MAHGRARIHQTVCRCERCHCRYGTQDLASTFPARSTFGYDVIVRVGIERFVHYRQRHDIRAALVREGVELSEAQVSLLGRRFLDYLQALHLERAPELRAALAKDGGWPLHIDATGENGQGTLFVAYAGWRGWVLGAWKIPTERADAISPKLRDIKARFGAPCAVMRDLGKAVIEAAEDFVAGSVPPIPVLGCHLHFLKDIGKDLLSPAHEDLRDLFRRFKVLPRLRMLARDLGRNLGTAMQQARQDVTDWLTAADQCRLLPEGKLGLAVVRALDQWVLDYSHEGTNAGFPFDRPYLDLYHRCQRACRAAESWLRQPPTDRPVRKALERLHRIVEAVRGELPFQPPVRTIESRGSLFDELRDALRLEIKPSSPPHPPSDLRPPLAEIRDVEKAVQALQASLRERRPERGPAQDTRKAIDLILQHLERHGPSLWGHVIRLPAAAGGGIRLVERTNLTLEDFWHTMKHGERRRSGRKVLSQDFEQLPPAAALARNLTKPDYVTILCGTLDDLPHAFAQLDATDRSRSLPARLRAEAAAGRVQDLELVSSSLPRADRNLVRTDALQARVMVEASSRAPRRSAGSR